MHLQQGSAAVSMDESLWSGFAHARGTFMTGVCRYEEVTRQLLSLHLQQGSAAVSADESPWSGFGKPRETFITGVCR